MLETVKKTIKRYEMLQPKDRVVLGVSGGADSTALLLALEQLQSVFQFQLFALHVDHGIRGEEAKADAAFVEALCRRLSVPFRLVAVDVPMLAKEKKCSLEEAGRMARYQALEEESKRLGEAKIAVAHQKEDQAETLLLRLCRGSGLAGLSAMAPVRGKIIRPLLETSRSDILRFLAQQQQPFCEDSTNASLDYTRNRLRHQVLPLLETVHPKAASHLAQAAAFLAEENAYLDRVAKQVAERCLEEKEGQIQLWILPFLKEEPIMRRRVFALVIGQMGQEFLQNVTQVHYEALEGLLYLQSGKQVVLPHGVVVQKSYDRLLFLKTQKQAPSYAYCLLWETPLFVPEANLWVLASKKKEKKQVFSSECYTKWIDCDKIKDTLAIRCRRPGDFVTLSKGGQKKLKDYFSDEKIAQSIRNQVPLLADGSRIWWVIGHRFFGDAANEHTKEIGSITIWEDRHG